MKVFTRRQELTDWAMKLLLQHLYTGVVSRSTGTAVDSQPKYTYKWYRQVTNAKFFYKEVMRTAFLEFLNFFAQPSQVSIEVIHEFVVAVSIEFHCDNVDTTCTKVKEERAKSLNITRVVPEVS